MVNRVHGSLAFARIPCDNRSEPTNSATELFRSTDVRGAATANMSGVTQILALIERGDPHAAEQLLPLVYAELRNLAAVRLAAEKPGQTLQPTALVHEAYLRLVDGDVAQYWDSRGHFFSAAAEAMRRILVEIARRKSRKKHGGQLHRVSLLDADAATFAPDDELLLLDEAVARLADIRPQAAELVRLRFFAGLGVEQTADVIGVSPRTARRLWIFAQAWLRREMDSIDGRGSSLSE